MKKNFLFMFVLLLVVNAYGYAVAQKVSIRGKQLSLFQALTEIRKQTGIDFVITGDHQRQSRKMDLQLNEVSLTEALKVIFNQQDFGYELSKETIVTVRRTTTERSADKVVQALPQERINVRGRVVDSLGNAIPGVSVHIIPLDSNKPIIRQTYTNQDGDFLLENVPDQTRVEFRLIGYKVQVMPRRADLGTIILQREINVLERLVVTGYQTRRASEVTGSVQSVSGEELRSTVSTPNVLSMLKGKTSGLYITESNGEAGQRGQVVMRGQSSMTTQSTQTNNYLGPLIVVDGVITNYQSLQDAVNPADIEDVSVLRDAASTAIYGSRAAQGVILVTTKRGQLGKSMVEARVQTGVIQPVRDIRFMNTTELIDFMDTQMTRYWEQTPSIRVTYPNVADFIRERRVYTDEDRTRNFNWEDAIYSNGNFTNTEVGVRHGGEKTSFYAGVGWFKENGALYDNTFDRKNIRINIDHQVSQKFHTSINVSSIIDRRSRRNGVPDLYMIQPFMYPYDANGNLRDSLPVRQSSNYGEPFTTWSQNFLAETPYDNTNLNTTQNHLASLRLKYDILPYLSVQSSNSVNYMGTSGNSYMDPRSYTGKYAGFPYLFSPTSPILPNGSLQISETKFFDYLMSNTLNFRKTYGEAHTFTALVGQEWGKRTTENMAIDFYGLLPGERNAGAAQSVGDVIGLAYGWPYRPDGYVRERATFSVFGQADYNYAGRYMLSGSVRTDATTNFGRDSRYGTFFSFSGGWLISQEDFFKDVRVVNNLRLRASYGTSGRDLGDGYLNTTFYQEGRRYEQLENIGATISQLENPVISWETLHNTNLGLDATFLNNRIDLVLDVYHKRSDGLLQQVILPSAQGALSQFQNVGQIVNRGIEVMLNTHNVKTTNFNWHSSFNFSYNKNEITKLYQDSLLDSYSRSYYRNIGDDINVIKAVRFAGINPENGNMQHYNFDENGNEIIVEGIGSATNLRNWQTVGQATPRFFGGFSNTFQYKNFTLSADWWFQVGNYTQMALVNNFQAPTAPRLGRNNVVFADNQRVWQGPGDTDANYPDVFSLDPNAWQALTYRSSRIWGNASHARLRTARLTYSLSETALTTLRMSRADIFISGDNLWVIKHKDFVGADPEGAVLGGVNTSFGGAGTGFANPRRFVVGVQVTF
ncbi:SusC/RagA family TonB-linked outer membrane protein [Sphingobacterium gobiense]|uniref:SusC/RagA family TonB-linked outer membrane protein n=1 Tax=Sphingobacterium gobiense TaxID=1382456 RepID=A0A2S9JGC1_9SPHI|nr:SusC/RagA family TonB-linked outer membrane protein [Sphingobacterium gobiense]PRD52004.1 hypothetical protein C5749_17045 [Sphingobacterium gobiense]